MTAFSAYLVKPFDSCLSANKRSTKGISNETSLNHLLTVNCEGTKVTESSRCKSDFCDGSKGGITFEVKNAGSFKFLYCLI